MLKLHYRHIVQQHLLFSLQTFCTLIHPNSQTFLWPFFRAQSQRKLLLHEEYNGPTSKRAGWLLTLQLSVQSFRCVSLKVIERRLIEDSVK